MDESNYEELIRIESEELAVRMFDAEYCELSARNRRRVRAAVIWVIGLDAVRSVQPEVIAA